MKILLVGDYSGVHNNLYRALNMLGHEAILASAGDSFKNFERTYDLKPKSGNKVLYNIERLFIENKFLKNLGHYDVIQIISPTIFSRFHISNLFEALLKKGNKTFMYAVGDDYQYWKAYREGAYRYSPHKGTLEIDLKSARSPWEYGRLKTYSRYLAEHVSGIITGATTYKIAYADHPNFIANIGFPIYFPGEAEAKLKRDWSNPMFVHGKQKGRYGFKGSYFIDKAIQVLQAEFKNRVRFETVESIPFKRYMQLLENAHGIFDQANCFEPAMNALLNMVRGRVVFGGCDQEFLEDAGIDYKPLININADVDAIVETFRYYMRYIDELKTISANGVRYVQEQHNAISIAEKFLATWKNSK